MDIYKTYNKQRCITFLISLLDPLLINSKYLIINYLLNNYKDELIIKLVLLLKTNNNLYLEYDKLFNIIINNNELCNFILKMSDKIYSY
jgi:hypothetical protein